MLEPIQQKTWPAADRRAWSIGLSLFFVTTVFAAFAWWKGTEWTFQTTLEYVPKELTIKAYDIASDLMEFSLGLPNYAFGEYFAVQNILPPNWIYFPALALFLLAISLLGAGVSYFEDTPLYLGLAGFGAGVALFGADALGHLDGIGQWASGLCVLVVAGPVYVISTWLGHWNLARRWWVLLIWYGGTASLSIFRDFGVADQALVLAHLWYPLLIGSILFIILNSTDVLQGMLTLLTRDENNTQSWLHFTVFSLLYLSNFILIYLKNTGQFVLDIFYFNPMVLQAITMGLGFWMIEKKTDLTRSENQPDTGLWAIYSALGMIFCLGVALSFGLANDLMWEVLEDAITLIHFCMGMSFFLYVLINFFQLMGMGLRVHLVVFKPRYMPVAGIPVFGLGAVVLFLINEGYFPYYQALSAREVLLADHSRLAGDRFLAENHLKAALSLEYRNQRTNLSLAGLYYEMGNVEKGRQFAEASLEKRPCPEAYLAMAQVHRRRGNTLEEILQLQEGIRKFPNDGRLLNNLGMAFNESVYTDSALTYFARAAETNAGAQAGKTNLGFFYLVHKLEKDGLPQKSPESDAWGDWAQMNNNMVFANVAGETSASLGDVQRKFADIPAEIQPFVLFHAYINKAITKDSTDAGALKKLENDSLIKYYSNALDMGRALLHYRTGQTHKGMDEMLHLFQRSNDRKLDLALLLGQVYYDQGAYESAALFFKQAAGMGMPKAMYWYALSSLDAGRKNEAIEAFRESIPHLSPSDRIRVSVLVDGLASGKFQNAAQRSDPEKSAYIKVFWNNLKDDQITDLIGRTSDKESQRFLWKYCFDRAYREGMASRCQELHYYGQKHFGKNALWIVQLGATRPLMLEITGKLDVLEKTTDPDFLKKFPFLQARLNQKKGDKAKARISFLEALELQPLHTRQIGYALSYLFQEMGNKDEAYQKALEFSDLDPSNVELLKLYALFSVRMGLPEFAYPVVNRIEVLTNAEVAGAFRQKINQEVAAKNYYTPPLLP